VVNKRKIKIIRKEMGELIVLSKFSKPTNQNYPPVVLLRGWVYAHALWVNAVP